MKKLFGVEIGSFSIRHDKKNNTYRPVIDYKGKLYMLRKFNNRNEAMKALTEAQKELYDHVRPEVEEAFIEYKRKWNIDENIRL